MYSFLWILKINIMTQKELIKRLMDVVENYKKDYLYKTGILTDIGVLVDEYTETVVKNCTISVAEEQSKQATKRCFCGAEYDGIECNNCGFDASEIDIY